MKSFITKYCEQIAAVTAFVFFTLVTCYQLTGSALWYDEAIEYWYSKILVGELPMAGVADGTVNMYQRILLTYQPPLYNILMYFWLKVSDTELWFRLFGVLMGLVGMAGIYKSVKKVINGWTASVTVICASTTYQLYSYWQECAEYCLLLGCLCWVVYFWICLIQEINIRNMICFTVVGILAVYSQYGAAFPVGAMAITAYFYIIWRKNKKNTIAINIVYIGALTSAALPLYTFFIRKQMVHQQMERNSFLIPEFPGGILYDLFESLYATFYWNFFSYIYSQTVVRNIMILVLFLCLMALIFGRHMITKMMIIANILCWLVYYIAVKFGAYSYGNFGRRYNLFFIPLWIILIVAVCAEIYSILPDFSRMRLGGVPLLRRVFTVVCLGWLGCYTVYNWTGKLKYHSYKSDIRGVVQEWYARKGYEDATIVYYAADPGFAYYIRQHGDYDENKEEHVTYMEWSRDLSIDAYSSFIDRIYGREWPEEIYIAAANYVDDLNTLTDCFLQKGYAREDVYDKNAGKLVYLFQMD